MPARECLELNRKNIIRELTGSKNNLGNVTCVWYNALMANSRIKSVTKIL